MIYIAKQCPARRHGMEKNYVLQCGRFRKGGFKKSYRSFFSNAISFVTNKNVFNKFGSHWMVCN